MRTKSLIKKKGALLSALFLLFSVNLQAKVWMITKKGCNENTTACNNSNRETEGTYAYSAWNALPGDTIMFHESFATDTIRVGNIYFKPGNLSPTDTVTIIGNGVTFAPLGTATTTVEFGYESTGKPRFYLKNLHILNCGVSMCSSFISAENCLFEVTDGTARRISLNTISNGARVEASFTNCAFINTQGTSSRLFFSLGSAQGAPYDVTFVSCTFYNSTATTSGNDAVFIETMQEKVTVKSINCVWINPRANSSACLSVNMTKTASSFISRGYNVMQGVVKSANEITDSWAQAVTDTLLPLGTGVESPLVPEDNMYKVCYAGGQGAAYRRLPPNPSANVLIQDIHFPEKDLAGNTIDYTKATHSGAWQTVYLAADEEEDDETVTIPANGILFNTGATAEMFTERTLQLEAYVQPNTVAQAVSWTSSDPSVASIDENGLVTAPATTETTPRTVTITAVTTGAMGADENPVSATVTLTVKPYIHVSDITLDDGRFTEYPFINGYERTLTATVEPSRPDSAALNPALVWTAVPEGIVGITTENGNTMPTLKALSAGTATVTATAVDNSVTASVEITVLKANYTDGVFIVNEDWFGTRQSSVNYLYPDGHWDLEITTRINGEFILGTTTQFGTIYGDKFYFVSKQGLRLSIADATTMEWTRGFVQTGGDGRSFLGVDDTTGYVGTSSGIRVVNLNVLANTPGDYNQGEGVIHPHVVSGLPHVSITGSTSGTDLYSGQIGLMVRAGNFVFAVQQDAGMLVINAKTHRVQQTLTDYEYSSVTLAKDGYLYAGLGSYAGTELSGTGYNYLIRIDPWTLERKSIQLPAGMTTPASTWGAWQHDPFWAGFGQNVLYWIPSGTNKVIVRYDIEHNQSDTVLNLNGYKRHEITAADRWSFYGTSFRVQPGTESLYALVGTFDGITGNVDNRNHWKALKIDPNGGQPHPDEEGIIGNIVEEYPLPDNYWFPAMPVFPDTHRPEFMADRSFPDTVTLGATHSADSIGFGDKVYDADNITASIVATVVDGFNKSLVNAYVWRDTLIIAARKIIPIGQPAESTTITLKFNSNGHVITKEIPVTVEPSAQTVIPVESVTLSQYTETLTINAKLQLTATVSPGNATNQAVTWTSNNTAIATVDDNGLVTAHSIGTATIIVVPVDGGLPTACNVTVQPTVVINPFELNTHSLVLDVGQFAQLGLTVPEQYTVTWRSNNENVAIVSSTGKVFANAAGTVWITAKDLITDRSDSCKVTIRAKPVEYAVRLNHTMFVMNVGDRTAITAAVSPLTHEALTWSSSNMEVAEVTANGTVIALASGNTVIGAQLASGAFATCNVIVRDISVYAGISDIGPREATLTFPSFSDAAYYLVHLFEVSGSRRTPAVSYRINPDGTVTDIVHLRALPANIRLRFIELKPSTAYEVDVDVMREINGTAEATGKLNVSFTTAKQPTDIERIEALNAAVWYSGGTLRLRNLEGYNCRIASVGGQVLSNHKAASNEETRPVSLSPGVYILTAQKDGERLIFKFVAF